MSFLLGQSGRSFFHSIVSPTRFRMFDAFYCCLMVGLAAREVGTADDLDAEPFLANYPDDMRAQADLIAGLLIDAELERKQILPDDKEAIEKEMTKLIDPTSTSRLNAEGDKLLNLYAAAGFALLKDKLMPPADLEDFLVAYDRVWTDPPSP